MEVGDEAINWLLVKNSEYNKISTLKCKKKLSLESETTEQSNVPSSPIPEPPNGRGVILGKGFENLALNKHLVNLDLSNHLQTSTSLKLIAQSTSIRTLILRNCGITNSMVKYLVLAEYPLSNNLQKLDISRNKCNDRFISNLRQECNFWSNMNELVLSYNPMTMNVLQSLIAHCGNFRVNLQRSLKRVEVNGMNIRDEGFASMLLSFENLEHVEANECCLTNTSLVLLSTSKKIKWCKLNGNKFHLEDKSLLNSLFSTNTMLETIGLATRYPLTDKEFKRLRKALSNNHSIQSISLTHKYLTQTINTERPKIDFAAEDQFRIACSHIHIIKFFDL